MRQLASVKQISAVKPIENADRICAYQVDGWWVVDQKDKYSIGDLVIYFEIDSFLPIREEFEFLRKNSYKNVPGLGEGFRLKTIKLKGQVSQGLLWSTDILGDISFEENQDVTELLGVQKFEIPEPAQLAGYTRGSFPSWIRKTDQTRVQSIFNKMKYKMFEEASNFIPYFEVTEKLDGSSMSVYFRDGETGVCSRNNNLKIDESNFDNVFINTALEIGVLNALAVLGKNVAIQGELCGPGIQGNKYWLGKPTFYVFDIWDIDNQCYLTRNERSAILKSLEELGCKLFEVPLQDLVFIEKHTTLEDLLQMAEDKSFINNQVEREGLVFKSIHKVNDEVLSFKAISNKFLLGEKD